MRKPLLPIAVFVLFTAFAACAGCASMAAYNSHQARVQHTAAVTVRNSCGSWGSGALLGPDRVITAFHVVNCAGELEVITRGRVTIKAKILRYEVAGDVAVLQLSAPVPGARRQSVGRRPRVGDRICLVSAIPGNNRECGEVTDLREDDVGDVQHNMLTQPGNSGSGIYNGRGQLVGVVTHLLKCGNGQYCGGLGSSLWGRRWMVESY